MGGFGQEAPDFPHAASKFVSSEPAGKWLHTLGLGISLGQGMVKAARQLSVDEKTGCTGALIMRP